MHRRLRTSVVLIALILAAAVPDSTSASQLTGLRADLDGNRIPLAAVGQHYCYDFDWPIIHCYSTSATLEVAVSIVASRRTRLPSSADVASSLNYIRLYDLSGYAGPYIYLSADYSDLRVIGWNDRASSYVAVNSLSSGLYVNTSYTGATLLLCCNQHAPSLSSTFDNQISSARRT
jgi:hypothetical protein